MRKILKKFLIISGLMVFCGCNLLHVKSPGHFQADVSYGNIKAGGTPYNAFFYWDIDEKTSEGVARLYVYGDRGSILELIEFQFNAVSLESAHLPGNDKMSYQGEISAVAQHQNLKARVLIIEEDATQVQDNIIFKADAIVAKVELMMGEEKLGEFRGSYSIAKGQEALPDREPNSFGRKMK